MKQFILSLGLMFASGAAIASPLYLTFRLADGAERSFVTSSLSMTVGPDGKMMVSNVETSEELDLSSLGSMRFSEEVSDMEEKVASEVITVFSLKGEKLGDYKSVKVAEKELPAGTYIFKTADKTEKKIIK